MKLLLLLLLGPAGLVVVILVLLKGVEDYGIVEREPKWI